MKWTLLLILSTIIYVSGYAQKPDDIIGIWGSPGINARIQVYKVGNEYRGKIVYLKDPKNKEGRPKTDIHNPNKQLRSRPLMGLEVLHHLVWENGEWAHGKLYDADSGNTYSCFAEMDDINTLRVRAFLGFSVFGKTVVWQRVK